MATSFAYGSLPKPSPYTPKSPHTHINTAGHKTTSSSSYVPFIPPPLPLPPQLQSLSGQAPNSKANSTHNARKISAVETGSGNDSNPSIGRSSFSHPQATSSASTSNSAAASIMPPSPYVSSSISSARRPSTGNGSNTTQTSTYIHAPIPKSIPQGVGYPLRSPSTTTNVGSASGSGIPSFRGLRSLLPFGPSNSSQAPTQMPLASQVSNIPNPTPSSCTTANPNASSSKSPFASFGSVRRSMTKERDQHHGRERKTSLSSYDNMPVISIERSASTSASSHNTNTKEATKEKENTVNSKVKDVMADIISPIRRSLSLSTISIEKPLPKEPQSQAFHDSTLSAFMLRTPSPGPPLSAELSTIIEADNSGMSIVVPPSLMMGVSSLTGSRSVSREVPEPLHPPSSSTSITRSASTASTTTSTPPPPTPAFNQDIFSPPTKSIKIESTHIVDLNREHEQEVEEELDLSTTGLADQVRDALRNSASFSERRISQNWEREAVVVDLDADADEGEMGLGAVAKRDLTDLDLDAVDPQLIALLSPNKSSSGPPAGSAAELTSTTPSRLPTIVKPSLLLPKPSPSLLPSPLSTPHTQRTTNIRIFGPSPQASLISPLTPPRSSPKPPSPPSSPKRTSEGMHIGAGIAMRTAKIFGGLAALSPSATSVPSSGTGNSNANTNSDATVIPGTRSFRQVISRGAELNNSNAHSAPPSPSLQKTHSSSLIPLTARPTTTNISPRGRSSFDVADGNKGGKTDIGLGRPSLELRRPHVSVHESVSPALESQSQYRPSLDSTASSVMTTRVSLDRGATGSGIARPASASARLRERERDRERRHASNNNNIPTTFSASLTLPPIPRMRKRSMSVQDRSLSSSTRGRFGAAGGSIGVVRPGSSLSVHGAGAVGGMGGPGGKFEWIGARTFKAFRAAGLIDGERDAPAGAVGARSASVNGQFGPSSHHSTMRSASEYNSHVHHRAQSRMTLSEIGGPSSGAGTGMGKRGSGSFSAYGGGAGLMESPTFTVSSGSRDRDRDTLKTASPSTAPTSVSESYGFLGRERERVFERERDRERDHHRQHFKDEVNELRERHATEMGALLGALSDSQRTVKMLREENAELRERVERVESEWDGGREREREKEMAELVKVVRRLERELGETKREVGNRAASGSVGKARGLSISGASGSARWSTSASSNTGFRTPVPRQGNSSPLIIDATPHFIRQRQEEPDEDVEEDEIYNSTIIIHDSIDDDVHGHEAEVDDCRDILNGLDRDDEDPSDPNTLRPLSTSTPSIKRRMSDSSSVFPVVPSNMTMLLGELEDDEKGDDRYGYGYDCSGMSSAPAVGNSGLSFPSKAQKRKPYSKSKPKSKSHTRSGSDSYQDQASFSLAPGHISSNSISSTGSESISPTTANFSIVTGSPHSLFLRPEHEDLLGDLETLDLGLQDGEEGVGLIGSNLTKDGSDDGW